MEYCISDHYRPTIYQHFHQWLYLSETRHGASVRGAQPVDVGSVAAVGDMRITGGGRSLVRDATVDGRLASVRAEIHFNITSQREVPEIFV